SRKPGPMDSSSRIGPRLHPAGATILIFSQLPTSVFAFCFLTFALCLLPCRPVLAAEVYLGLQAYGGAGKALGVGIAPFTSTPSDAESVSLAGVIRSIMREDILFTRLFSVTEGGPVVGNKLDSAAWSGLAAQVLVTGDVKADGPQLHLECRIYDVSSGKILWGKEGAGTKI